MSRKSSHRDGPPSGAPTFKEAFAAHQAGNLAHAELIYRLLLAGNPKDFATLHFLGLIHLQRGDYAAGERFIRDALAIKPSYADAHSNLGFALLKSGRFAEALASYDKAVALDRHYAEAHFNRGIALKELRRFEEAIASYDKALKRKPDYAEALTNRGNALQALGRLDCALASFKSALAVRANYAEAHFNCGNVFQELAQFQDALASYDSALKLRPDYAEAFSNRGNTLYAMGRFDEALASFDRALTIRPDYAEAHCNRGNTLKELKQFETALASYERALALNRDYAEVYFNLGNVLNQVKRSEDALASFDKALSVKGRVGDTTTGTDADRGAKATLRYVETSRLYTKMQICDWSNIEAERLHVLASVRKGAAFTSPFQMLAFSSSPADHLECAKTFIADKCSPFAKTLWNGEVYAHNKIRIAYMAVDFREHPVSYAIAGMFEQHDRTHFEPIAVSLIEHDGDDMRRRIKSAFEIFIDAQHRGNEEIADIIRQLEVDILIDLTGFTRDNRVGVLSHRPAPIQVNYLAYPGTMGGSFIDYIIADRTVIPDTHRAYYTEHVVWLPDSYHVNDNRRQISKKTPTRQECGLPETAFVFCCFNQAYKITPDVFDIWMRLLKAIECSVLWLYQPNSSVESNLRREAEKRGVASGRLIFATRQPFAEHLARHRQADLFLDTLPYNAHTTANDALWAGLPVLTCLGESFPGRVGASLLSAIGLAELITHSLEEYEAFARRLAQDPILLRSIKTKLVRNRYTHPLFDTTLSTRNIEAAYRTMWEKYQRGESPSGFWVSSQSDP
jgi:protein O-GlcNAc transferase